MLKLVLMFLLIFHPFHLIACLWKGGENAYWPTNTIKTCFTNPNASIHHQRTALTVIDSIKELSDKTRFRFVGFTKCKHSESEEHQIRIALENVGSEPGSYNVGPSAGLMCPNLILPLQSQNSRSPASVSSSFIDWTTKHDVIHLLGVLHDQPRASISYDTLNSEEPNLVTFGEYDANSITLDNQHLSEADIQCLNMIALRKMHLVYNGAQSAPYSSFEQPEESRQQSYYIEGSNSLD